MDNIELHEALERYFAEHRGEFIESICRLIAVRSVNAQAEPGMPYGKGPAEALQLALQMAEQLGLSTHNADNYAGTADLNRHETKLGILVHLDVVPEGEHWRTDPFEGILQDGKLYGRGASDDKGPAVAAMYALAAVKALGIELNSNVRLIFGTDEESGCRDLRYYFARYPVPPYLFTADGEFPVLNTEKGGLFTAFSAKFPATAFIEEQAGIMYARGGSRSNVVPGEAEALIRGLKQSEVTDALQHLIPIPGVKVQVSNSGTDVLLTVLGKSTHASEPQSGSNAVTALLALLSVLPLPDSPGLNALRHVGQLFPHGDVHGLAAGIAMEDELSGKLTVNLAILDYTSASLTGVLDCRLPLCATEENTRDVLLSRLQRFGLELSPGGYSPAHHVPSESPFIRQLLSAYEEYSGVKGECMSTGGWSYVHGISGGVNFGPAMPGTPTGIHGPDEYAVIEDLLTASKIYARVIMDLCGSNPAPV